MSFLSTITNTWENLYQVLFYTWPFVLVIVLFLMKRKFKKFPIEAVIFEKRGDNLIKTNDRLGKIEEASTGMSFYRFSKSKETIPVLNYEWVLHSKVVHTNFIERILNLLRTNEGTVFLFKYGSRQYKPIPISANGGKLKLTPMKDTDGKIIYSYQYEHFDPRWVVGVLNFDVIDWDDMNFMVQEQRASIERRTKKRDKMMQYIIPITIIAASLIVSIFILKFSSDAGARLGGGGGIIETSNGGGGSRIAGALGGAFTPGE